MNKLRTLEDMGPGEQGTIKKIDGGHGLQRRLNLLGLGIGKKVRKITSEPFRGPVVVEVDGGQIAIGRGIARKVWVGPVDENSSDGKPKRG
ncbi:MAG: ferrous iron transport protein A [Methanobacteriota archaeon]|nr:MAG: ferrous iron transport protein A [Euryarchaeota archaeon]